MLRCSIGLTLLLIACGDDSAMDGGADAGLDGMVDGAQSDTSALADAASDSPMSDGGMGDVADGGADVSFTDVMAAPDLDRDDDGVDDVDDAFPDDPNEWIDSDGNGVGNAAQTDEDGDGEPDTSDAAPLDPSRSTLPETMLSGDASPTLIEQAPPFNVATLSGAEVSVFALAVDAQVTLGFRIEGDEDAQLEVYAISRSTSSVDPFDAIESSEAGAAAWAWTPPTSEVYDIAVSVDGVAPSSARVHVYFDQDADGVDDDLETALGMRPANPDPDNDGLSDRAEFAASLAGDQDGDGLPAWLDPDTDGDGLFDREEGLADSDGDGVFDFLDTDSDDNGVDDAAEEGVATGAPRDLDGDNTADWRDLDDDGDSIWDVNDAAPGTPASFEDGFAQAEPFAIDELVGTFSGGQEVRDVIFAGNALELRGTGFSAAPTMAIVRFDDGRIDNAPVAFVSATVMRVVLGRVGRGRLFLVRGNVRTAEHDVEVLSSGAPLLYPPDANGYNAFSRSLVVDGENLENVNRIVNELGERSSVSYNSATQTVTLGGEFRGNQVRPVAESGEIGNAITIRALNIVGITPIVPAGAIYAESELTLSGYADEVVSPPVAGQWRVNAAFDRPSIMEATVPGPAPSDAPLPVLKTLVGPNTIPAMNVTTTAAVLTLELNQAFARLEDDELELAYAEALADASVAALAATITSEATSRTDYIRDPSAAFLSALEGALLSVEPIVDARAYRPPAALIREGNVVPAGEQSDVRVFQTDTVTGNVSVENDTSFYLSAAVRNSAGHSLQSHVASYFDLKMIAPQRGIFLGYWASTGGLNAPGGRNADIDVVTPGLALPQPSTEPGQDAQFHLRLRTLVDKFILPVISEVVSARLNPGPIVSSLMIHNYDAVQDVRTAFASGQTNDAVFALVNIFLRDAENLGPITQAIIRSGFGGGTRGIQAVARISGRLAAKLNMLGAVVSGIATVGAVVGIAKVIADIADTPGLLQWRIEYGLEITSASVQVLERVRRPQTVCLNGVGFRDDSGNAADFTMRNLSNMRALETGEVRVNAGGTEVCIYIPSATAAVFGNVVEFGITRADTGEEATRQLPVQRGLRAERLQPAQLTFRQRARIDGSGFGNDVSHLRVFFRLSSDGSIVARAPVLEAQGNWLTFDTPHGIQMGTAYDMNVEVVRTGFEDSSNVIPINIDVPPTIGRYEVRWRSTDYERGSCEQRSASTRFTFREEGDRVGDERITFLENWGSIEPGLSECTGNVGLGGIFNTPNYGQHVSSQAGAPPSSLLPCANDFPLGLRWEGLMRQNRVRYHFHFFDVRCGSVRSQDAEVRYTPDP